MDEGLKALPPDSLPALRDNKYGTVVEALQAVVAQYYECRAQVEGLVRAVDAAEKKR